MSSPSFRRWFLSPSLVTLCAFAPACSDDASMYTDAGTYNCMVEDRDDTFWAGMTKSGAGGVEVTLVSSTPAPPIRGDNSWTLAIRRDGEPVVGAAVEITPFMPDHRHGTPISPVVTPGDSAGQYQAAPVNLWMPGLWEITVATTPSGGAEDSVVFRFCITG
jgi:hypothetical protein